MSNEFPAERSRTRYAAAPPLSPCCGASQSTWWSITGDRYLYECLNCGQFNNEGAAVTAANAARLLTGVALPRLTEVKNALSYLEHVDHRKLVTLGLGDEADCIAKARVCLGEALKGDTIPVGTFDDRVTGTIECRRDA